MKRWRRLVVACRSLALLQLSLDKLVSPRVGTSVAVGGSCHAASVARRHDEESC